MNHEHYPRAVTVESAPPQNDTYSQAVILGQTVYVSGQLGVRPDGTLPTNFSGQVRQALENVRAVLEAAGTSLDRVAKVNIYVTDFGRLAEMNVVYREFFPHRPAKTTVEIARLDKGAQIEVEVVAGI
ncbi:MAG: RidA family protein [Acidobacteria bacterium]|nr:RidA family protein [Acidobacteriota bacterium]